MIQHVVERLAPQVDKLIISSNRNEVAYRALGYEIVSDTETDFQGPIAGILAGLEECGTPYALVCPCDSPNLPVDLVERLREGLADGLADSSADIAVAHDGEQRQNLVALMKVSILESLQAYFQNGGRAVRNWYPGEQVVDVDFSSEAECFLNINRPEDMDAGI